MAENESYKAALDIFEMAMKRDGLNRKRCLTECIDKLDATEADDIYSVCLLAEALIERAGDGDCKRAMLRLVPLFFAVQDQEERRMVIECLTKVAEKADPVIARFLHERRSALSQLMNAMSVQNHDGFASTLTKAFYFGGATQGATLADQVRAETQKLRGWIKHTRRITPQDCYFQFLKDYSSHTPLLTRSQVAGCRGGGYFLVANGYGIVIDPGHHFMLNFYEAGYSVADIDAIIVTHFHDDHYADLPALLSLLFQRYKSDRTAKVDLLVDETTRDMFSSLITGRKSDHIGSLSVLCGDSAQWVGLGTSGVEVRALPTLHDVFGANSGVGLHLRFRDREAHLVITGDTAWNEQIQQEYELISKSAPMLVAHVSSAKEEEILNLTDTSLAAPVNNHLCIYGLCMAVESLHPCMVTLSEIGEELREADEPLAGMIEAAYHVDCFVAANKSRYYVDRQGRWRPQL